jgi:hypothetical protein
VNRALSRSIPEAATAKSPIVKKSTANATKRELNAETYANAPAAKISSTLATETSSMISNSSITKAPLQSHLINRSSIAQSCTLKVIKNSTRNRFSQTKIKFSQVNETAPAGLSSPIII